VYQVRVYIETYGCALNRSDEALMIESILEAGHTVTRVLEEADAIVINTCTVRLDTEYHMVKRIKELHEYSLKTGKKLVVAGCMAKAQPYTVSRIAPSASLLSPQNATHIAKVFESPGRVVLINGVRERDRIGVYLENRVAPIAIQEGCLSNCSFCITRFARRILVSHSIEAVERAVREAVGKGAVEIQLTGMDLGTYGVDLYKARKLPELVKAITRSIEGNYMVRIGMINPEHLHYILDDLVEAITESPRVYRFLHIPLQSGSNRVLKAMRRNYSIEEYMEMMDKLKAGIPDVSIATDIIVGHPLESEEDFAQTLEAIEKLEFERVHLAGYSIRPLTYSASLPQLPTGTKKNRILRALKTIEEVGLRVRMRYAGKHVECFTTEYTNTWICRLVNYIPVVIVRLSDSIRVDYGEWVKVHVEGATFFDLRATYVDSFQR